MLNVIMMSAVYVSIKLIVLRVVMIMSMLDVSIKPIMLRVVILSASFIKGFTVLLSVICPFNVTRTEEP